MNQPMYLQVFSLIDVIDDKVVNAMEVFFVSVPLVGVLWKFRGSEIKEYNELISSWWMMTLILKILTY